MIDVAPRNCSKANLQRETKLTSTRSRIIVNRSKHLGSEREVPFAMRLLYPLIIHFNKLVQRFVAFVEHFLKEHACEQKFSGF